MIRNSLGVALVAGLACTDGADGLPDVEQGTWAVEAFSGPCGVPSGAAYAIHALLTPTDGDEPVLSEQFFFSESDGLVSCTASVRNTLRDRPPCIEDGVPLSSDDFREIRRCVIDAIDSSEDSIQSARRIRPRPVPLEGRPLISVRESVGNARIEISRSRLCRETCDMLLEEKCVEVAPCEEARSIWECLTQPCQASLGSNEE